MTSLGQHDIAVREKTRLLIRQNPPKADVKVVDELITRFVQNLKNEQIRKLAELNSVHNGKVPDASYDITVRGHGSATNKMFFAKLQLRLIQPDIEFYIVRIDKYDMGTYSICVEPLVGIRKILYKFLAA